jgi:hypothetical protein
MESVTWQHTAWLHEARAYPHTRFPEIIDTVSQSMQDFSLRHQQSLPETTPVNKSLTLTPLIG